MRNIILIIIEVVISYTLLSVLSKKYKTDGIYVYAIIATIISSIMNLKTISIMEVTIPIGFGITTSLLIGANIIIQKRGKEDLKMYFLLIILSFIISYIFINISVKLDNSNYNLLSNISYNNIFKNNLRMYIAIIISIIFSIWLDSNLYYIIKKIKNKIILSNIFSIIIVEFFENIVFVLIAFLLEKEPIDLFLCIIIRYIIKTIIGLFGTIPLYILNNNN